MNFDQTAVDSRQAASARFGTIALKIALAIGLLAGSPAQGQDSAEYEFEFVAEWSALTHPVAGFPSNPHFSPIVGSTHTPAGTIWQAGGIASPGIEQMAETGATSILRGEILGMISDGNADQYLTLGNTFNSPGSRASMVSVDAEYPLISIVTMVAPSPDWFAGIHDVDLRPGGIWAREMIIDLDPYDSGTDAGVNYNSGNSNIVNHLPIENIEAGFPFLGNGRLGTIRLTLASPASCSIADIAEPYDVLDLANITAFIDAFTLQDEQADLAPPMGVLDLADISAFIGSFSAGCP